MPFTTIATGSYSATYNNDHAPGDPPGKGTGPRDLGLVEGVRRWVRLIAAAPVTSTQHGESHIDAVYRGGQCFVTMTLKEWSAAVRDVLWPFDENFGEVGSVGRLLSDLAGELTLTAEPGTRAAAVGPATLKFGKAILAPEQRIEIPLGAAPRDVHLTLQCFLYVNAAGKTVWFEEE